MKLLSINIDNYYYEHLLQTPSNIEQIKKFVVNHPSGKGLENYLKTNSVDEELNNSSRTYLVKDNITNEIVAYFTLKAGLFTIRLYDDKFNNISAIELSNFAVNSDYKKQHPEKKFIGANIFTNIIIPVVKHLQHYIGVQALYIFALPEDSLIEHYTSLGFSRLEKDEEEFVHVHVKPKYDDSCIFMFQLL